jgi:peptidoglycan/xylan/chitin deacetylase (PgdA/CDA1 family)
MPMLMREYAPPTPLPPTPTPTATPLPTPDGETRTLEVPILMYHHITQAAPGASRVQKDLSVSPARFREQVQWLQKAGYHTITFKQLTYHLALGWPLPDKPIILTFDDGYRDIFDNAFPILAEHGFVGTFYLVTYPIDEGHPEYLTWDQVKAMHDGGMEFGAHSYTHPDLVGKTVDYIVWQTVGSKEAIESRIGEPVRTFAYPSGSYDQQVIDVIQSAHFWTGITTRYGTEVQSGELFEIPRIRIRGTDTLDQFISKVETSG